MVPGVSESELSNSDRRALRNFQGKIRSIYRTRLRKLILFGYRQRPPRGADLDILIVLDQFSDPKREMARVHSVTGPIKTAEDILITAVPVDAGYFESQKETPFFGGILKRGIVLG